MAAPLIRVSVLPDPQAPSGSPASSLDNRVISFTYEDTEKGSDKMTLVLENEDLELLERGDDVLGGQFLEVAWGYAGEMSPPRRVVLKSVRGFTQLTVEGVGLGVQLHRDERCRVWHGKTASDVVREVARENGFEGAVLDVEDTEEPLDAVNQIGETDARLLRRLAAAEGFQFWIDDLGLHWRSRAFELAPSHVFVWKKAKARGRLKSCNVESNLIMRAGRVSLHGRDPIAKKNLKAEASAENAKRATLGDVIEVVNPDTGVTHLERANATNTTVRTMAQTAAAVQREADARFRRGEREAVKLSIEVVGEPGLRAKSVVELRGISSMLSGLYFVSACTHRIDSSGYSCGLSLIRDANGARGTKAAEQGRPQTGEKNRSEKQDGGGPKIIERVDPDTGRIRRERRYQ